MTVTPTTQLDAVNQMLAAIGESPVSTLTGDVGVDVVTAKQKLDEVIKAVQTEGWLFNTEHDFPLQRETSGEITVPRNASTVDVQKGRFGDVDPVQRGLRLYDRKNHTYKFDEDQKARIIFLLPFEEMPQTARYYVAYRASREFQDNSVGSEALHKFNSRDEMTARIVFMNDQAEDEDLNFLRDDPDLGIVTRL
jgi:hypothetical protein